MVNELTEETMLGIRHKCFLHLEGIIHPNVMCILRKKVTKLYSKKIISQRGLKHENRND